MGFYALAGRVVEIVCPEWPAGLEGKYSLI
jgi:hypothetical protein